MTGGSHSPRLLPPVMGGIKTQTGGSPGGAKIFKIQGAPPGNGGDHREEPKFSNFWWLPPVMGGSTRRVWGSGSSDRPADVGHEMGHESVIIKDFALVVLIISKSFMSSRSTKFW